MSDNTSSWEFADKPDYDLLLDDTIDFEPASEPKEPVYAVVCDADACPSAQTPQKPMSSRLLPTGAWTTRTSTPPMNPSATSASITFVLSRHCLLPLVTWNIMILATTRTSGTYKLGTRTTTTRMRSGMITPLNTPTHPKFSSTSTIVHGITSSPPLHGPILKDLPEDPYVIIASVLQDSFGCACPPKDVDVFVLAAMAAAPLSSASTEPPPTPSSHPPKTSHKALSLAI